MKGAGFALAEVLLAAVILAFGLCGILLTYTHLFILTDLSRDFTLATNALQAKMEEIKKTNFDELVSSNFELDGFSSSDAEGRLEVSAIAYPDLKEIRLVACFKSRGRIIGEDKDLDGTLDSGEDIDGNGRLDSPLELVTLIAR